MQVRVCNFGLFVVVKILEIFKVGRVVHLETAGILT